MLNKPKTSLKSKKNKRSKEVVVIKMERDRILDTFMIVLLSILMSVTVVLKEELLIIIFFFLGLIFIFVRVVTSAK